MYIVTQLFYAVNSALLAMQLDRQQRRFTLIIQDQIAAINSKYPTTSPVMQIVPSGQEVTAVSPAAI